MPTAQINQPPSIQFRRDPQGRITERVIHLSGHLSGHLGGHLDGRLSGRLGDASETRRYAYDSAGRLARVTDETGALCESYQYDHQGRRLAEINPARLRGEQSCTAYGQRQAHP